MGSSKSKATTEQISEHITEIASSTVQNCVVSTYQTQDVVYDNSGWTFGGGVKITQASDVSAECFSDVNKENDLQTRIVNDILQTSTSDGQAVWPAFGNSQANAATYVRNIVKNNITMNNIQQSYNSIRQSQKVTFRNSGIMGFTDVDISQGAKLFAAATLKEVEKTGIFDTIETYVDQTAESSILGPFDSLMWIIILVIAFVFIVGGVLLWWVLSGDDPSQAAPASQAT